MKKIDITWIIDDDPIFIYGLKKKLKQLNFSSSIMISHDGEQALNRLKKIITSGEENLPDLILLDLNMPKIDGWQFMEEFERIPCNTKVAIYIITSSNNPVDVKKATSYDKLDGYLIKPLNTQELQKVLQITQEQKE